jgi:hypothetical protein
MFGVFHKTSLYDDDISNCEIGFFPDIEKAKEKFQQIVEDNDYEKSPSEDLYHFQVVLFSIEFGQVLNMDFLGKQLIKEVKIKK